MKLEIFDADLRNWLLAHALPLWAGYGVDHHFGGYHERLSFDLTPLEAPHRARLTARQIYCFVRGAELGWQGPASDLVAHGLSFLNRHLLTPEDRVVMAVDPATGLAVPGHDNYDVAFVLFALAVAARSRADVTALSARARRIAQRLSADYAHPLGGYQETAPATSPLRANPHMHLLEAFLEWAEGDHDADGFWHGKAAEIIGLAQQRMLLPSGAMPELFDLAWQPLGPPGNPLIEPGHQFEWGWLLARWARLCGDASAFDAALRLIRIGEDHGICQQRGVAINAVDGDFAPRDAQAKLWPQTERVKAWAELATSPFASAQIKSEARARLLPALAGLRAFLITGPPQCLGLWREVMRTDGTFINEPVRASSFYHLICALQVILPHRAIGR
ncbi:AGE family epimerase/isomerase [Xinfangfangia sp. CPCC 101601]|uniref:AGE family epimerase/isomerase n=1 Tax=Pseudogemmobacter lacusdianii TaxID=3069608 RepID=A0ABU0VVF0_9RHOB|nr:AGE family epimerase/isomerase [Xinfangfangia sp. CPCC 101601]MDQ2065658.1 AGE family epimerase/isomerase [Xinfangfangia sp. CPCC 101601]